MAAIELQSDTFRGFAARFSEFVPTISTAGGRTIVALHGDIDLDAVPFVADCLAAVISQDEADIVVDLADVSFIDVAGLRVLLRGVEFVQGRGRKLTFRSPSAAARRLIQLCMFTHLLEP